MSRQEFETLVNDRVSLTSYSEARFCLEVLVEMFPDWEAMAGYYRLNGPEGLNRLHVVASRMYFLQNETERLSHLADTLKESLLLCHDWRWPGDGAVREPGRNP